MGKLDGKVAIITGASRGIGEAVAIGFAKEGARVAIVARTAEKLASGLPGTIHEAADKIKAVGGEALPIKADITDEKQTQNMARLVLDKWGRIDILVNNAARAFPGSFMETTAEGWNNVMGSILLGTFLCTRAVVPIMIKQKSGNIINTTSRAATSRTRTSGGIAYGTAKAGIEHFTYELAAELGRYNIAVNCYHPVPAVAVPKEGLLFTLPPGMDKSQMVGPEDMVKCAIFLAQQDAKGVTGCVASSAELIQWHGL
jgi:NAD(P)-dependent dehydrogenase (short-subunit alcohol dehydrogenase family)